MDQDPEHFRKMAWRDGLVDLRRFLDRIDEAAAEHDRWAPILCAFAAECRRAVPTPAVETFVELELAQYRILRKKMSQFAESTDGLVTLAPRPHHVAVLSTTRVGLAAAAKVFSESSAVILEESERTHWFTQIYRASPERLWWYSFASWRIQVGLDDNKAQELCRRYPASSSNSYWIVESGVQWGPLAGGCREELWRFDGARGEFVETCGDVTL
jgi:hypothetical protein